MPAILTERGGGWRIGVAGWSPLLAATLAQIPKPQLERGMSARFKRPRDPLQRCYDRAVIPQPPRVFRTVSSP